MAHPCLQDDGRWEERGDPGQKTGAHLRLESVHRISDGSVWCAWPHCSSTTWGSGAVAEPPHPQQPSLQRDPRDPTPSSRARGMCAYRRSVKGCPAAPGSISAHICTPKIKATPRAVLFQTPLGFPNPKIQAKVEGGTPSPFEAEEKTSERHQYFCRAPAVEVNGSRKSIIFLPSRRCNLKKYLFGQRKCWQLWDLGRGGFEQRKNL